MMFARCPACLTLFRVRPEQLGARRGEVRCGHCFNRFNALDHLVTEAGERIAPETVLAPPDVSPAAPPASVDIPAAADAQAPAEHAEAADGASLDFDIPEVWRSPRERLRAAAEEPLAEPAPEAAPEAEFVALEEDAAGEPDYEPSPDFGRAEPTIARAFAEAPADDTTAEDAPPPSGQADVELPPNWTSTADEDAEDAERLDALYGSPTASAGRRWLWGLGVGILLGALAVQSAYLFRQEITRSLPVLRPFYLAACAQFGCTLPLPRDAERIGIDASDLQSDPRAPWRYVLHATVRNRAEYVQEWPHLELTLTDARDRPLVRRVLDPFEWAHAETAKLRAGFPAGREQVVELHFDAPGLEAVGYRVYIFYP
ncbi:DUF3426 domain-containing protein [Pseudothauera rhizosphaerae]|uniref:DUF3426 domain-containing protein n=1 Tax=Pseudothauera rhizosphaerae TaxID=2565932 RepID=A0A4S4APY3_9RHOO|nr:DUF3426 domain-containing protein [Pseudothauera rhizosphaerae]THF61783.1 DUF3426 domain-containing protein [Pseudothauera rhizosphaerae]